ncbi:hypothetical protein [Paenibacillus illinoisensis]
MKYRMTFFQQGRGQPPYIYSRAQPISPGTGSSFAVRPAHSSKLTFKSHDMKWQMPIPEHMMPEMNVRGRSKLHE